MRTKIKKLILIILIPVFSFSSVPFLPAAQTNALSSEAWGKDGIAKVKAWLYYKAFRKCLAEGQMRGTNIGISDERFINQADVPLFQWFSEYSAGINPVPDNRVTAGAILDPVTDPGINTDDGILGCGGDEGAKLNSAVVAAFGVATGNQFLCEVGFFRESDRINAVTNSDGSFKVDSQQCPKSSTGSNDYKTYDSRDLRLKLLDKVMSVYFNNGGNPPQNRNSLPNYLLYILYRETFLAGSCGVESSRVTYDKNVDPKGAAYVIHDMDSTSTEPKAVSVLYSITNTEVNKDSLIPLYENVDRDVQKLSCSALALYANDVFNDYRKAVEQGVLSASVGGATQQSQDDGATQCVIDSIGWIVCGLMNAIGGVNDAMYAWIKSVLILNPLKTTDDSGAPTATYQTWQNIRNIANVLLVIGFIFIIFSQLTSIGVSNYGVKKLLPRIILVAIAINLSYIAMQLSIDIVNLVGVGLETVMNTTSVDVNISAAQLVESLTTGTAVGAIAAGAITLGVIASGASAGSLALLALPFIVVALLGLLAAVATLFLRNALVIVLVVISPVAIAAYLLPNTEELFHKWRKLFTSMLILFPMATIIFAGGKFAAYVIVNSGVSFSAVIGLFVMAAPLGALPFLIKSSNSILSGVGNRLQGLAEKARNPIQKGVQGKVDQLQAERKAGQRNLFGRQLTDEQLARNRDRGRRSLTQRMNEEKMRTEMKTEHATGQAKQDFKDRALGTGDHGLTAANSAERNAAIMRQRNRDAHLFDEGATLKAQGAASDKRIDERQAARARAGLEAAINGGNHNTDSLAATQFHDANRGSEVLQKQIGQMNNQRILNQATSTTSGENLLVQSQASFAAEQGSKAVEGQILNINRASGAADASVQQQKTNDLVGGNIDAHEQEIFDQSVAENQGGLRDTAMDTVKAKLGSEVAQGKLSAEEARRKSVGGDMLTEEMERRSFKELTDARNLRTDQMQQELATDSTASYLNFAGTENRARLQDAAEKKNITQDAMSSAKRVADNEYAEQKLNDPSVAQRAAGIDTEHGEALVQAQAYETQRKASETNVAAYGVKLRQENLPDVKEAVAAIRGPGGEIIVPAVPDTDPKTSMLGRAMDSTISPEEREAAGRALVAAGNIDAIVPYQNYLAEQFAATTPGTPEREAVVALQKAYGETIGSSPGKPMGLGAADIAAFKEGKYTPPTPPATLPAPVRLSPTQIQTLNTVIEKGVSMDGWASMDKTDIDTVRYLITTGAIPKDRLDTMWESLNTALADPRWYGRIKEREQDKLEAILSGTSTSAPLIPAPGGKARTRRK